jgi:hypothetical protein
MSDIVRIIRCGSIFFFTTPLPAGSVMALVPREQERDEDLDVEIHTGDQSHFVLIIGVMPRAGRTSEQEDELIFPVLRHTWAELTRRGVVTGEFPELVAGDPLLMLPGVAATTA